MLKFTAANNQYLDAQVSNNVSTQLTMLCRFTIQVTRPNVTNWPCDFGENGDSRGLSFAVSNAENSWCFLQGPTTSNFVMVSSPALAEGASNIHTFIATVDHQGTGDSTVTFRSNGNQASNSVNVGAPILWQRVDIGRRFGISDTWDDHIHTVAIWDRILTAGEIAVLERPEFISPRFVSEGLFFSSEMYGFHGNRINGAPMTVNGTGSPAFEKYERFVNPRPQRLFTPGGPPPGELGRSFLIGSDAGSLTNKFEGLIS